MNSYTEKNQYIHCLFQYPVELSKLESDIGEPRRVIKFNK